MSLTISTVICTAVYEHVVNGYLFTHGMCSIILKHNNNKCGYYYQRIVFFIAILYSTLKPILGPWTEIGVIKWKNASVCNHLIEKTNNEYIKYFT